MKVTEEVTGEDLVELMLSVAAGNKLPERLRHTEGSAEHDAKACMFSHFTDNSINALLKIECHCLFIFFLLHRYCLIVHILQKDVSKCRETIFLFPLSFFY